MKRTKKKTAPKKRAAPERQKEQQILLTLNQIAEKLQETVHSGHPVFEVVEKGIRELGYYGGMCLTDETSKKLVCCSAAHFPPFMKKFKQVQSKVDERLCYSIHSVPVFKTIISSQKKKTFRDFLPVMSKILSNFSDEPVSLPEKKMPGISIPILHDGKAGGILSLYKDKFDETDAQIADIFAKHIAIAIANYQLLELVWHKTDDLETINQIHGMTNSGKNVKSILEMVSDRIEKTFSCGIVPFYLLNPGNNCLDLQMTPNLRKTLKKIEKKLNVSIPEVKLDLNRAPRHQSLQNLKDSTVFKNKKAIRELVREFTGDVFPEELVDPFIRYFRINYVLVSPLRVYGKMLGLITAAKPTAFKKNDLLRISFILDCLTAALDKAHSDIMIRDSEQEYSKMLNAMDEQMFVVDKDLRILKYNEAFKNMNRKQMPRGKFKGTHILKVMPFLPETIYGEYARVFEKGETVVSRKNLEINRHKMSFESKKIPVFIGGTPNQALTIVRDITAQLKADQDLKESEIKYRNVVERANDGIVVIQDQLVKYVNPMAMKIGGYSEKDIIGKPFINYICPEERPKVVERYRRRMAGEDVPQIYETALQHKSGKRIEAEFNASMVMYDGRPADIAFIRDITERKKSENALRDSEEKFKSLAEKLPNMVFINQGGRIVYVNERCVQVMGYPRKELYAPDFDFMQLIAPESRKMIKENFRKHATGEEVQPIEYKILTRTGEKISAINSTKLIQYGNGPAILGVVTDIEEQNRFRDELVRAKEAAEKANMAKSEFLSTMSHELRTPLTSILGFSELFYSGKIGDLCDSDRSFMEKIIRNGKHLLNLINTMLDLARIETGNLQMNLSSANLHNILTEVVANMTSQIEQKKLNLSIQVDRSIPEIRTDAMKLKQVIINILGNAVKFTEKGDILIRANMLKTANRNTVCVDIIDTGIGIEDSKLGTIFEKFQQADQGFARKYGGTGIGLSISKSIMNFLGGSIKVQSKLGKGSIFSIIFPADIHNEAGENATISSEIIG